MKRAMNILKASLAAVAALAVALWIAGVADVNVMLYVAYVYLAMAVAAVLGMSAVHAGKGRSGSRAGLIIACALLLLSALFYFAFARTVPVRVPDGRVYGDPFILRMTDAILYLTYAVLGIAVALLVAGEIRKAIK